MSPYDLIGMKYRLGADPERHGAADCLSLARTVLLSYGLNPPPVNRDWYRRLKSGDTAVFRDELEKHCVKVDSPRLGTIALCHSPLGYGMASYFESGWLCFVESVVTWKPSGGLEVLQLYCLTN